MESDVANLGLSPPSKQHAEDATSWPLTSTSSATDEKRQKRQSLRLRPTEHFENAVPPSPLKDQSFPPESLQPKASRMSLFNLFSRPKVERQRGYTERNLEIPAARPPVPTKDRINVNASAPNLLVNVQQANAADDEVQRPLPSPTPTAPAKTTSAAPVKPSSRIKFAEPANRPTGPPVRNKSGHFEPPPLFQAYPQSTKEGLLEVSTLSVEAAQHKAKGRRDGKDRLPEDQASIYTNRSRMTVKHGAYGANAQGELPRKIFVLATSGYILQYAESGPSNRLPERILQLGKDSAAFASDLLPGKHFVLQVSQAVDQNGMLVSSSGGIFSKLGIRSAATKRMTSSFLLVMPDGAELGSWMTAIRREIEILGGKKLDPDPVPPTTQDAATAVNNELKKTPSHRYQVKRNPSKIERVASEPSFNVTALKPDDEPASDSDAATIDGIEMEASKLDENDQTTRDRAHSDVPSLSSSAAVSVDQTQLNNLRSSESNSARTSNTSQGTIASPAATPQVGPLTDSPPVITPLHEANSELRDGTAPLKLAFRPMASSNSSWRRSGAPSQKPGVLAAALNISPSKHNSTIYEESPVSGRSTPVPKETSPKKSLSISRSEPNLQSMSSQTATTSKRDSKISLPPPLPISTTVSSTAVATPEAGEQPKASAASSSVQLPNRRSSLQPLATPNAAVQQAASRTADGNRSKRISFSMPLKVNPSGIHAQPNSRRNSRRVSQLHDPDAAGETPAVHTLTATIDPGQRSSLLTSASPNALMPSPDPTHIKRQSTSRARYSLLPAPLPLPPIPSTTPPTRQSPSVAFTRQSPSPTASTSQAQAQANGRSLKRPTSLQVRSDYAPFLSSVRNSGQIDARAIPIRGMRPSRSASNVAALAGQTDPFKDLKMSTPTLPEEEDDQAMPLPDRAMSPLPRPGSRTNNRRGLKTRSSLPELDLGIPVVGLGPPAPPPNAPLPLPPPGSRTTSPSPTPLLVPLPGSRATSPSPSRAPPPPPPGIEAVAGLGIRVS